MRCNSGCSGNSIASCDVGTPSRTSGSRNGAAMTRGERRKLWIGLAFISPWIVGFLLLTVYPVCASIFYSFCDYDVLSTPVWIGTMNYRDMITDSAFWKSLYNTLYYAV